MEMPLKNRSGILRMTGLEHEYGKTNLGHCTCIYAGHLPARHKGTIKALNTCG